MSETQTEAPAAQAETDPNFSVERVEVERNGKKYPAIKFRFGSPPREIVKRDLTLADEFDLIGVAGDLSNNQKWMILASLAWGADRIDAMHMPKPSNMQHIRAALDRIGTDGLNAYLEAVGKLAVENTDLAVTAKN